MILVSVVGARYLVLVAPGRRGGGVYFEKTTSLGERFKSDFWSTVGGGVWG